MELCGILQTIHNVNDLPPLFSTPPLLSIFHPLCRTTPAARLRGISPKGAILTAIAGFDVDNAKAFSYNTIMKKNIHMLVTDLDGTLLHSDKSISDYTVSVFQRCREKGIKIVFATGRPERTAVGFAQAIPPDGVVSNNGAGASVDGQAILRKDVPPAAVTAIMEQLLAVDGIKLSLDYGGYSLTNCEDHAGWGAWNAIFSDLTEYDPNGVPKISIEAMEPSLLAGVNFEALGCHVYANQGEKWHMVQEKSATKRSAVEAVAAHFGIALSDVVAFGDDQNDIEMLRACGTGVAVANAIDEAKDAADFVCGTNDDDGPAHWIEENLL